MNTNWEAFAQTPLQSAEDVRRHVTDKALADEDFRSQLIANPKAAISQELGVEVPEDVNVVVHESDSQNFHFALPVTEISEEQLEAIAAGRCCC